MKGLGRRVVIGRWEDDLRKKSGERKASALQ